MTGTTARGADAPAPDRDALVAEKEFLLRSLDDLERNRDDDDIDPATYERLNREYTARAAAVARALRDGVDERPRSRRLPTAARVGVVVAVVAFSAVTAVLLTRSLGARLPGQGPTGGPEPGAAATDPAPDSVAGRLASAREHAGRGDFTAALRQYGEVARLDPSNVEARAYGGWMLAQLGLPDDAVKALDRAIEMDPGYADARFFKGFVLYRAKHDPAAAIPELRRFFALAPDSPMAPQVRRLLEQALAEQKQEK